MNMPAQRPASDRTALVALYNATGGASWENSTNWLSDAPLNLRHGVKTDDDGRVVSLGFRWSGNGLSGTLPTDVGNLTNLVLLNLVDNSLTGPLPQSLTVLMALDMFYFHNTGLCVPANDVFQSWIKSINEVRGVPVVRVTFEWSEYRERQLQTVGQAYHDHFQSDALS